jgi:hypothetical protein
MKTTLNKGDKGMAGRNGKTSYSETVLVGANPVVIFRMPLQPVENHSFKSFGEIAD